MAFESKKQFLAVAFFLTLVAAVGLSQVHCTVSKPAREEPAPNNDRSNKSFFVDFVNGGMKSKTFICGWAPVSKAGAYAYGVFDNYQHAEHCNLEWEINKDVLIGKMVNPSHPNDRNRWTNIIAIPIKRHYYVESAKDELGRDTNKTVENGARSDWSSRPYMDLDFTGATITNWSYAAIWGGQINTKVEDVEWDEKNGFLGFTVDAQSGVLGSSMQARIRFNFKEFKHNEKFSREKVTPYDQQNTRYLNVLQIIGKKIDGVNPVQYAAKWDTDKVHEIYLVNFPKEFEKIGHEVVADWNDVFQKVVGKKPFKSVVKPLKYSFDLRYPSITWIADKEYSASAPLGVAMATADVKNGEILWGSVSMWGGGLEHYVKHYTPTEMVSGMGQGSTLHKGKPLVQLSLAERDKALSANRPLPKAFSSVIDAASAKTEILRHFGAELQGLQALKKMAQNSPQSVLSSKNQLRLNPARVEAELQLDLQRTDKVTLSPVDVVDEALATAQRRNALMVQAPTLERPVTFIDSLAADFAQKTQSFVNSAVRKGYHDQIYNADTLQKIIGQPTLAESLGHLPIKEGVRVDGKVSRKELVDHLYDKMRNKGALAFDTDRTFRHVSTNWALGMSQAKLTPTEVLPAIVKDIMLHEFGHMIGMGHNFKENILPQEGSVPEKYHKHLSEKAEKGFINFTTVMGYKNGITDILTPYEDIKPGFNDELVMRYIYKGEYPIFAAGEEDFKFEKVKADGIIRPVIERDGKEYKVAFFEQCNDFDASGGEDPYCNRWDRGADAISLVENYFEDYRGSLVSQLYSFSDSVKGQAFWNYEYHLWEKSFTTFSRTRVFYDYMRMKYADLIKNEITVGGAKGEQNLLDFSTTCVDPENSSNKDLAEVFKKNEELRKLCVASGKFVAELEGFLKLPGSDFTKLDPWKKYAAASVFGGDAEMDWSKMYGVWKELSRTPIKFSALYALTFPYPTGFYRGWLMPVSQYVSSDANFLLNTFYPKEYTQAIASTVNYNLTFGNTQLDDQTKIGKAALSLGYFLSNNYESNDSLSIDTPYIENIRNQASYDFNFGIVEVKRKDEPGKEIARKFSATLHNFYSSRGSETIPEIYLYRKNRTIIMPPSRSLLFPISSIRWYSDSEGYYYVLRMDYADDYYDRLKTNSVKSTLESTYYSIMKSCIEGKNRNGLRYFFNSSLPTEVFPGFTFRKTLWENTSEQDELFKSVEELFQKYETNALPKEFQFNPAPNPRVCEEAIRGQGLLVLTAGALSGFYLPQIYDFIEKGGY